MLKKTVTYEDYNGVERTKSFHFHLSQTDLAKLSLKLPEDIKNNVPDDPNAINNEQLTAQLVDNLGGEGVIEFIEMIVLKAYGIKHEDGERFEKSEEISKAFSQTAAFDAIMMEFMTNAEAAAEFVRQVIPAKMADKLPNTMIEYQAATEQQ